MSQPPAKPPGDDTVVPESPEPAGSGGMPVAADPTGLHASVTRDFGSNRFSPQVDAPSRIGPYEILGEIGRGGMGVVYEARQAGLDRKVALKVLRTGLLAGCEELRRFRIEADSLARLDHPGIIPVYEAGEFDGQPYFSMRRLAGGSLADRLDLYRRDPTAAATLMVAVSDAIAHAHARGILHRDLKPANILIDERGRPQVTDFGLAKFVSAGQGDSNLTHSGALLGTPAFMAPEQASGRTGAITTSTDVYGLGAVLYAVLTGRQPFQGESLAATLQAVLDRTPDAPRRFNTAVPRDLETICLKCLEKETARRYPTAQAVADDLRRWLRSEAIQARPTSAWDLVGKWGRRHPAAAALVAVGGGGAGALLAFAIASSAALQRQVKARDAALAELREQREQAEQELERMRETLRRWQNAARAKAADAPETVAPSPAP